MKILMIGMHPGYRKLFATATDLDLYILEEPDIYHRDLSTYESYGANAILLTKYQQDCEYLESATRLHERVGFDAVVPSGEYGVHASGRLAEKWGLPSPGRKATAAFTDKIVLRNMLMSSGVRQPRWTEIRTVEDVEGFYRDSPIVLKPSNRHSSIGVVQVKTRDDIGRAWRECSTADESRWVPDRPRASRFLAEEFLPGYQVSVETLVKDCEPVYHCVDYCVMTDGRYFAAIGVTVPAPIPEADHASVTRGADELVAALEVENGMLHSEWKVNDGKSSLLECAARVPGAQTPELSQIAYNGFSMYEAHVRNLAGLDAPRPGAAHRFAGARWFTPPSGRITSIVGLEETEADPHITKISLKVGNGDDVDVFRDSSERIGFFTAQAPTAPQLEEVILRTLSTVRFDVR